MIKRPFLSRFGFVSRFSKTSEKVLQFSSEALTSKVSSCSKYSLNQSFNKNFKNKLMLTSQLWINPFESFNFHLACTAVLLPKKYQGKTINRMFIASAKLPFSFYSHFLHSENKSIREGCENRSDEKAVHLRLWNWSQFHKCSQNVIHFKTPSILSLGKLFEWKKY